MVNPPTGNSTSNAAAGPSEDENATIAKSESTFKEERYTLNSQKGAEAAHMHQPGEHSLPTFRLCSIFVYYFCTLVTAALGTDMAAQHS